MNSDDEAALEKVSKFCSLTISEFSQNKQNDRPTVPSYAPVQYMFIVSLHVLSYHVVVVQNKIYVYVYV